MGTTTKTTANRSATGTRQTPASPTKTVKAAPAATPKAKAADKASDNADKGTTGRGHSLASKEGMQKCQGACGKRLPVTKFPTLNAKPGEVPQRGKICRDDMRALRAAKKAAAAKK